MTPPHYGYYHLIWFQMFCGATNGSAAAAITAATTTNPFPPFNTNSNHPPMSSIPPPPPSADTGQLLPDAARCTLSWPPSRQPKRQRTRKIRCTIVFMDEKQVNNINHPNMRIIHHHNHIIWSIIIPQSIISFMMIWLERMTLRVRWVLRDIIANRVKSRCVELFFFRAVWS